MYFAEDEDRFIGAVSLGIRPGKAHTREGHGATMQQVGDKLAVLRADTSRPARSRPLG